MVHNLFLVYLLYMVCKMEWNSFIPPCTPDSHPHRITSTKCRINTVGSPDDGHSIARNVYRLINILRNKLCTKLDLFTRLERYLHQYYIPVITKNRWQPQTIQYGGYSAYDSRNKQWLFPYRSFKRFISEWDPLNFLWGWNWILIKNVN